MHIAIAHRLSADEAVPLAVRRAILDSWGAFLLGNVAPDARVSSGLQRADTHFFEYQPVVDPPAAVVMLTQHTALRCVSAHDANHAAFVAGYVAHLAVDEVWCMDALYPLFAGWGDSRTRFEMLHMLLGHLDERDFGSLPTTSDYEPLHEATPACWLPFMTDADLVTWRDLIADQLSPRGHNRTFDILSKRIGMTASEMATFTHDRGKMSAQLWAHVPYDQIQAVEQHMYDWARRVLIDYYADTLTSSRSSSPTNSRTE
jgi:hypothetical protein